MERFALRTFTVRRVMHAVVVLLLLMALQVNATDVPTLQGRVNDDAQVLGEDASAIDAKLAAHEQRTGDQVVVLTVRSLGGQDIESYANDVFTNWKLGQKGVDNGVLIVVAVDDHRMRIEVGYGLEDRLTDLDSSRIIRERMRPHFADGDYVAGVESGVDGVLGVLDGDASAAAGPARETPAQIIAREGFWKSGAGVFMVLALLFCLLFGWMASKGGSWWMLFLLGPITLPLLLLLWPWWAVAGAYAVHVVLTALWRRRSMRCEHEQGGSGKHKSTVPTWPPSLWQVLIWYGPIKGGLVGTASHSRSGGSDGSSGSSSSGYSGGGGSSGGGGASGSW
jgi:uncharacterized protein